MSYIAPIQVDFVTEMIDKIQKDQELAILTKVKMVADVDKDELLKALQYDRGQYEQGYKDGYCEAIENVRAKLKEIDVEFNYLDSLLLRI